MSAFTTHSSIWLLRSSTPINVTLVASGMPIWMMLVGSWFFGAPLQSRQIWGALLSMAGVLVVMCRGEWAHLLELRLVPGDLLMILATIAWSFYSWLPAAKTHWAITSSMGAVSTRTNHVRLNMVWLVRRHRVATICQPSCPDMGTFFAVFFIAIGPAIIAYRCWVLGYRKRAPISPGSLLI